MLAKRMHTFPRACQSLKLFCPRRSTERSTASTPVWFQLKHSHQQPYSLLRLHPDLPMTIHHCFYLPFARDGGKSRRKSMAEKRRAGDGIDRLPHVLKPDIDFLSFFSNGKKCIVRAKEISMGIWGKRSWNEHPVHRCLLWIVYRLVVIESSEQGSSSISALLRVFGLSMHRWNIWVGIYLRKVLWEYFKGFGSII